MIRHPWSFLACILLVSLGWCPLAGASNSDLIGIVVNEVEIGDYLESVSPEDGQASSNRPFKALEAFGEKFAGRVLRDDAGAQSISLWVDEPDLEHSVGSDVFANLGKAFSSKLGKPHLVNDVPNYGDGSEVKTDVQLWISGPEVISLTLTRYSSRAGVIVRRMSGAKWQAEMGADEGEFWEKKLETLGLVSFVPNAREERRLPGDQAPAAARALKRPGGDSSSSESRQEKGNRGVRFGIIGAALIALIAGAFWIITRIKSESRN